MCGAQVSVAAGAVLAGASPEEVKACEKFAVDIGLAFQGTCHTTFHSLDMHYTPRHVKGPFNAIGPIEPVDWGHLPHLCRCHACADQARHLTPLSPLCYRAVADDILDVTASTEALGKTAGKDLNMDKTTYPKLLGLDGSRKEARRLVDEAKSALSIFGDRATPLLAIADYIVDREN